MIKNPTKKPTHTTLSDIGFMLPKLFNNQEHTEILKAIRNLIDASPDRHICVFASYNERIDTYNVPILHLNESKFFYGNLFLFDVTSIILSNKYPNIHARYWYATNTPWTDHSHSAYQEWSNIFLADNLGIVAQSSALYDVYNICWKKPIGIMEKFDHESITKIIR